MAALYTPDADDHGLSVPAQLLDADLLANHVLAAEQVLKLVGTAFTADDAEKAKLAVARQVNLQVRLSSGEAADIKAESKGRQSWAYATRNGTRVAIDSLAQSIVEGMLGPPAQSTPADTSFRW